MKKLAALVAALAALLIVALLRSNDSTKRPAAGALQTAGESRAAAPGAAPSDPNAAGSAARASGGGERAAVDGAPGSTPALASAAGERDGFIEVKVTAAGKPKAAADVRLYWRGPADPGTGKVDWRLAGAAKSGANGVAKLAARPGHYLAVARAAGFAPARREVQRSLGEPTTHATLALEAGASLRGRTVQKGSGEPVPLASIVLTQAGDAQPGSRPLQLVRLEAPAEEQARATGDARGAFHVDGLAPGFYALEAHADGFGRAYLRSVRVPRDGEIVVELTAASFIEGHVLAADGSPAAGAEVFATGNGEPAYAVASERGAFSLEVQPRAWHLAARKGRESGAYDKSVPVVAGQTASGVEIRLAAAAAIAGTVSSRTTGKPLAGARVSVSPAAGEGDSGHAESGADGSFAVEGLAPGGYDVVTDLDGYGRDTRRGVTVQPSQRFPLQVQLQGTGMVSGVVRDSAGLPVEGAVVERIQRGPGPGAPPQQARTGPDGRYWLTNILPGRAQLSARRDEGALGPQQAVDVAEGQTAQLDFTLADDGFIVGRVTRKAGPMPDSAAVRAIRNQPMVGPGDFAGASPDAQGNYKLQLAPGSYRLMAVSGTGMRLGPRMNVVQVEPNKTVTRDLELVDEGDDPTLLTISIVEPGGAPSTNALVRASAADGNSRFVMITAADEQGRIQLSRGRGDLPDRIEIHARNGGRAGSAVVAKDSQQAVVQLAPAARVQGSVSGLPENASFKLSWKEGDEGDPLGLDDSREFSGDKFTLDEVPAGALAITARASDGRSGQASVATAPGQTAQVQIALAASQSISGRLVDKKGAPVADAMVLLDHAMSGRQTSGDGRFTLDDVSPGAHAIGFAAMPFGPSPDQSVSVQAGQKLDLGDVVLQPPRAQPGSIGAGLRQTDEGVSIAVVIPGGPAEAAGLQPGDLIAAVDGRPLAPGADARAALNGAPGSTVTLTIVRNGARTTVAVVRAS